MSLKTKIQKTEAKLIALKKKAKLEKDKKQSKSGVVVPVAVSSEKRVTNNKVNLG